MSGKPRKRLVSKREYFRLAWKRIFLYFTAIMPIGTTLFLLVILFRTFISHTPVLPIITAITLALSVFSLTWSGRFFIAAKKIEKVELITDHNQHLLPPEESLVRAAYMPPSLQQAELLRSAHSGTETPSEELLRATIEEQNE